MLPPVGRHRTARRTRCAADPASIAQRASAAGRGRPRTARRAATASRRPVNPPGERISGGQAVPASEDRTVASPAAAKVAAARASVRLIRRRGASTAASPSSPEIVGRPGVACSLVCWLSYPVRARLHAPQRGHRAVHVAQVRNLGHALEFCRRNLGKWSKYRANTEVNAILIQIPIGPKACSAWAAAASTGPASATST
jgi:hypothetical protein